MKETERIMCTEQNKCVGVTLMVYIKCVDYRDKTCSESRSVYMLPMNAYKSQFMNENPHTGLDKNHRQIKRHNT